VLFSILNSSAFVAEPSSGVHTTPGLGTILLYLSQRNANGLTKQGKSKIPADEGLGKPWPKGARTFTI
jgi:hypothetical protein